MGFLETQAKAKAYDAQNARTAREVEQEWAANRVAQNQARAAQDAAAREAELGLAYTEGFKRGLSIDPRAVAAQNAEAVQHAPNEVNTQMYKRPAVQQPTESGILNYFKGLVK